MTDDSTRVLIPVDEPLTPVHVHILKHHLAKQGLHVVTAADKAVLDACADLMDYSLTPDGVADNFTDYNRVAAAELARRKA